MAKNISHDSSFPTSGLDKDLESSKEPSTKGKVIQKHLESINMDAWYYIYQVYVKPPNDT